MGSILIDIITAYMSNNSEMCVYIKIMGVIHKLNTGSFVFFLIFAVGYLAFMEEPAWLSS